MSIVYEMINASTELNRDQGRPLTQYILTPLEADELVRYISSDLRCAGKITKLPDHIYLPTGDKVKLIVGP